MTVSHSLISINCEQFHVGTYQKSLVIHNNKFLKALYCSNMHWIKRKNSFLSLDVQILLHHLNNKSTSIMRSIVQVDLLWCKSIDFYKYMRSWSSCEIGRSILKADPLLRYDIFTHTLYKHLKKNTSFLQRFLRFRWWDFPEFPLSTPLSFHFCFDNTP